MKNDHPILITIHKLCLDLVGSGIFFYPGHADVTSKDAQGVYISNDLIPVSSLKPRMNKSIIELRQQRSDKYPEQLSD